MQIRKTRPEELDALLALYAAARRFMAANGNPTQWGTSRPSRETVERDVCAGDSYVCLHEGRIAAAFSFCLGEDPTYAEIWDGAWPNAAPYGVVHRLASAGIMRGAGAACLSWATAQCANVRIDTHAANAPMRRLLARQGFVCCGRIYAADGTERLAFQYTRRT